MVSESSITHTYQVVLIVYHCPLIAGPDGTRNHRVATNTEKSGYVGEGARSGETTSNLGYMFRMPQSFPFPKGKHGRLGEIGGEIEVWNIKKGL